MAAAAHSGAPLAARANPRRERPRPALPPPSHSPDPQHTHHPYTKSLSSPRALLKLSAILMAVHPSKGAPLDAHNDSNSMSQNIEQRLCRHWPSCATRLLATRHSSAASRQPPATRPGSARARVWRFRLFGLKGNSSCSFDPAASRFQFRLSPIRPQPHILSSNAYGAFVPVI